MHKQFIFFTYRVFLLQELHNIPADTRYNDHLLSCGYNYTLPFPGHMVHHYDCYIHTAHTLQKALHLEFYGYIQAHKSHKILPEKLDDVEC